MYCCASCRQMAYMERRLNPLTAHPSIDGYSNSNEASIDACGDKADLSIDGYTKNQDTSIDTLEHNHQEQPPKNNLKAKTYKHRESRFLNGIAGLIDKRDYLASLGVCMYHQNIPTQKTGIRLKCLAECLLMFSEAKLTELDDLKEVCNAFTMTIQSTDYKRLPESFPYAGYIVKLRDRLKRFINDNRQCKSVPFRLSIQSKTELIATRFELSEFFPKTPFCDLNFSD